MDFCGIVLPRESDKTMQKTGFTLAEVLITLAIIGVVASLTLPALMQNSSEQQAKTALKKCVNTLTEIAQTSNAIDGYDYSVLRDKSDKADLGTQSLYSIFARRGSIDMKISGDEGHQLLFNGTKDGNFAVFFRDGTAISFPDTVYIEGDADAQKLEADGLPRGYSILFDMNGLKSPNTLSNCNGSAAGNSGKDDTDKCNDKTQRVIKDQFGIRLRGSYAVPNGYAARWAFEN